MKGTLTQVFATLIVSLALFFMSFAIAWPSYALEVLESDDSPLGRNITEYERDLIGSLPMLGSFVVSPFSGLMADSIGRKRSYILVALCYVLSWSILATAKSAIFILISRFITGVASGVNLVLSVLFASEIGTDSTKGPLVSMSIFVFTFGTLASYVVGWLMSYQAINYLGLTLSVGFVVLMIFVKETPVYLISKNCEKEALQSLMYYRGVTKATTEVLDEFDYLKGQNNSKKHRDESSEKDKLQQQEADDQNLSPWKIISTSKPTQRALLISLVNTLLIPFGGTISIQAYAGPLFNKGAPGLSKNLCSIVLSLAFVLGSLLSIIANGTMGRRTLQITSAMMSSIILAILASLLHWSWAPEWLVPAAILSFSCFYQMGVGNVNFIQIGEIFLPKVKSLVMVLSTSVMSLGNFIVLAVFNPTVDHLGLDGAFLMFSMVCALTAITAYFTMRETKGLPFEEVQRKFENGYLNKKKTTCK